MRNSYKEWSSEDIELLKYMVQKHTPMRRMKDVLGRTEKAIQYAFQKILYQQCVHHDAEDVADTYDYTVDDLVEGFVPPKYYQPLDVYENEDENEPTVCNTFVSYVLTGALASACIYYYAFLIQKGIVSIA